MTQDELLATVQESGECEFTGADDANIPVGIWLREINLDEENVPEDHKWILYAENFMPRKDRVSDSGYRATAPTREALVEVVRRYIVPLYENALANLQAMINGTKDCLYYWDSVDGE